MHCAICWNESHTDAHTIIFHHITTLEWLVMEGLLHSPLSSDSVCVEDISSLSLSSVIRNRCVSELQSAGNQRVAHSTLVAASETTRAAIEYNADDLTFNSWLAGFIDGNGHLTLSSQQHMSCELTVDSIDKPMLCYVQSKLGCGAIKLRSGSRSYRWRLHTTSNMIDLLNRINGHIRNSKRLPQLHKLCVHSKLPVLSPMSLTDSSA